jgi:hypothetical protein
LKTVSLGDSLEILDRICEILPPKQDSDRDAAWVTIQNEFPTVTDFEREFPSLCFSLATGVGKTRLMGQLRLMNHPAITGTHQRIKAIWLGISAAVRWCQQTSDYMQQHGGKPWCYVLIPHDADRLQHDPGRISTDELTQQRQRQWILS